MGHVIVLAGSGFLAGSAARRWLAWLHRGARVPPPWCELAVGALWAAAGLAWVAGRLPGVWLPLLLGLGWLAAAGSAVDLACRRLPDALTLAALPAAFVLATPLGAAALARAALAALALSAAHLAVRLAAPAALGAGDVKLSAALGAALGAVSWPAVLLGVAGAAALTALVGAAGLLTRRLALGAAVPHGPAMLAAAWLVVATAGLTTGGGSW
jgi:leader peptidase (prepilin peptidase)/N-methyltransferase